MLPKPRSLLNYKTLKIDPSVRWNQSEVFYCQLVRDNVSILWNAIESNLSFTYLKLSNDFQTPLLKVELFIPD